MRTSAWEQAYGTSEEANRRVRQEVETGLHDISRPRTLREAFDDFDRKLEEGLYDQPVRPRSLPEKKPSF